MDLTKRISAYWHKKEEKVSNFPYFQEDSKLFALFGFVGARRINSPWESGCRAGC